MRKKNLARSQTITIQNKILGRKNPHSLFRSNVKAVDAAGGLSVLQRRCSKEKCGILNKPLAHFATHNEAMSLFDQSCFVPEIQSRCCNSGHPMVLLPWWWWPWTWRRLRQCELMIHRDEEDHENCVTMWAISPLLPTVQLGRLRPRIYRWLLPNHDG